MLAELGYDPSANPPNYGSPDAFVADNTRRVKADARLWEHKAKTLLARQEAKDHQDHVNDHVHDSGDDFGSEAPA